MSLIRRFSMLICCMTGEAGFRVCSLTFFTT
jgi:hypothetical protein